MNRQDLAVKYTGDLAANYDAKRMRTQMWHREQALVESFLAQLDHGQRVLDIPVGSGRFLNAFGQRGFEVVGIDLSQDMLDNTARRAADLSMDVELRLGDIFAIDADYLEFDTTVCVRIFQWIERKDIHMVIKELCRITRSNLIVGTRHYERIWDPSDRWIMPYKRIMRRLRRLFLEEQTRERHVFHHMGALEREFHRNGFKIVDEGRSWTARDMAASVFFLKRIDKV